MSRLSELTVLIGLFLLRLGVPLAITLLVGLLLRRLDAKWETEARRSRERAVALGAPSRARRSGQLPCWLIRGCPEDLYRDCPAYKIQSLPCWLARLRVEGRMPKLCANCTLFRSPVAPSAQNL